MEHTECEEPTHPDPNSPLSSAPASPIPLSRARSQPVKARTQYSFTGYKYLTDASMHGAAQSPWRHLNKHTPRQSLDQAPSQDRMQHPSPPKGSPDAREQSITEQTQTPVNTPGSNLAQDSGYANGDRQKRSDEGDSTWQEHSSRQDHLNGHLNGHHLNGHKHGCESADGSEDRRRQAEMQQQRQQHCRFKVIDFGHADLEPIPGSIAPGLIKTK